MTEFPALRDALVRAAARRRRRRRRAVAVVPALAAGAVAIALLPSSPPERERVAEPPDGGALERAFAVFRRGQTPADRWPEAVSDPSHDPALTRLLGERDGVRVYAVPGERVLGYPRVCLHLDLPRGGSGTCAFLRTVQTDGIALNDLGVFAALLPDDTHDVILVDRGGSRRSVTVRDNALVADDVRGASWTGPNGVRHVRWHLAEPPRAKLPARCPPALDPLPADAVERARRAALLAVDRLYPHASAATVSGATPSRATPCGPAVTRRSIELSLQLVPRGETRSASLAQGRLLLGMLDGRMTVYYVMH